MEKRECVMCGVEVDMNKPHGTHCTGEVMCPQHAKECLEECSNCHRQVGFAEVWFTENSKGERVPCCAYCEDDIE